MNETGATLAERSEAVRAFDALYGEMDRTLWTLSLSCRPWLLQGEHSSILDDFVWTIKSWWGVQGVRSPTKHAMGAALAGLGWEPEHFEAGYLPAGAAEGFAVDAVQALVSRSRDLGAYRREYSLASKVLHWLMPWRVPVFDEFVRSRARIPRAMDLPDAYRRVADVVLAETRQLADEDATWIGTTEPHSVLHALDKWNWWTGGGSQGTAVVVSDPSKVLRRLGIPT